MKLTLKQMLEIAGVAKPAYDSRRRRDIYGFLHTSQAGDPTIAAAIDARRAWDVSHVVGIMCIEYASTQLGMTLEMADMIVDNNFGELSAAIANGAIDPTWESGQRIDHFFIGAVFNVVGRGFFAGPMSLFYDKASQDVVRVDRDGEHRESAVLAIQMIDASTVYRQVLARAMELNIG